jgi:hypothetical protein
MNPETFPIDRAAINRENSLKSTGPKTEAGKHISSLNALRHGLTGQVIVMPAEDLAAYERSCQRLHNALKPVGELEIQFVQSIADDNWRLIRARNMETSLCALGLHDHAGAINTENDQVRDSLTLALAACERTKAITTLGLHQNRIAHTIERTTKLLREIQADRRKHEEGEMLLAGRLCVLHTNANKTAESPQPYDPTADGFVFSLDEIKRHIHRRRREKEAPALGFSYESAA